MKIDLSGLTINFSERPDNIREDEQKGRLWRDYDVHCSIGGVKAGLIRVSLADKYPSEELNDFWHNLDTIPPAVRPVVVWQETEKDFYGQGVCGKLITLANEIAKVKFGQPLASDTHFIGSPAYNWKERGFAEHPSRRVWEKLEQQGRAYRRAVKDHARWVMK